MEEKRFPVGLSPENPDEDQPARASTVPELDRLLWALMLCLTQPDARCPDRQGDSWPHTQHFGHAMVLCRHLFLTLVFRYLNLDIISILQQLGIGSTKQNSSFPVAVKLALGMESHLQGGRNLHGP